MPLTEQQAGFIEQFIGGTPRSAGSAETAIAVSADPMAIWNRGKQSADDGINALREAMQGKDIPALNLIAEFGLNGLSKRNQTDLMKALFEFNMSDEAGKKTAAKNLSDCVTAYQKFVEGDAVIKLCENNPFGVNVDIKSPLVAALSEIKSVVGSADVAN